MTPPKYKIKSLIAKGATGGIYNAIDTDTDRVVAIRRFYQDNCDLLETQWQPEFLSTCKILLKIQNPYLLRLLDAGVDEEGPYLVTRTPKTLHSQKLSDWLDKKELSESDAFVMIQQVLRGIGEAHKAGMVHGSISIDSVWVIDKPEGPHFIVRDLGITKIAKFLFKDQLDTTKIYDYQSLAPEHFLGQKIDTRTDCYGIGHLVYASLLYGVESPFHGVEVSTQLHSNGALPAISNYRPELNPALVEWLRMMTSTAPEQRPSSIQQATLALTELLSGSAITNEIAEEAPSLKQAKSKTAKSPSAQVTLKAGGGTFGKRFSLNQSNSASSKLGLKPNASLKSYKLQKQASLSAFNKYGISTPKPSYAGSGAKLPLFIILCLLAGGAYLLYSQKPELFGKTAPASIAKTLNKTDSPPPSISNSEVHYNVATSNGHPQDFTRLESADYLDWRVYSAPRITASSASLGQPWIGSYTTQGDHNVDHYPPGNLNFFDTMTRRQIQPKQRIHGENSSLAWTIPVTIHPPNNEVKLTVHYTSWHCDTTLQVLSAHQQKPLFEKSFNAAATTQSYGLSVDLKSHSPGQPEELIVHIKSSNKSQQKWHALSLNAIVVESLNKPEPVAPIQPAEPSTPADEVDPLEETPEPTELAQEKETEALEEDSEESTSATELAEVSQDQLTGSGN
ncbi:protein kinase domain-containing protein [Rubritalea marina]|uniref:protein kinase domain-containing protein n=1 Tax=Rubritalea marina TaxID=361055 RepID=UPI0003796AF5|nr:protein kinase [Rubritalea marina]